MLLQKVCTFFLFLENVAPGQNRCRIRFCVLQLTTWIKHDTFKWKELKLYFLVKHSLVFFVLFTTLKIYIFFIFFFCDLIFTVQQHYYNTSHPHCGFKQVKRHGVMNRAIMLPESGWSVRGRQTTAQGAAGKNWSISTRGLSGAETDRNPL